MPMGNVALVDKLRDLIGNVDVITVGGDFEDVGILDLLSRFGKPVYAVLGNMDPLGIRVRVFKYLIEGRIIDIGKDLYLAGYPIEIKAVERVRT
jgi:hypothetical protein